MVQSAVPWRRGNCRRISYCNSGHNGYRVQFRSYTGRTQTPCAALYERHQLDLWTFSLLEWCLWDCSLASFGRALCVLRLLTSENCSQQWWKLSSILDHIRQHAFEQVRTLQENDEQCAVWHSSEREKLQSENNWCFFMASDVIRVWIENWRRSFLKRPKITAK